MIESVDFAKYILLKSQEAKIGKINQTKLQKLLYICDGVLLACNYDVINEHARAWYYGPVYPKVYKWYSKNKDYIPSEKDINKNVLNEIKENNYVSAVNATLKAFGNWDALHLSAWSHQPNSPWSLTVEKNNGKMNCVIDKSDMKKYFEGFVSEK